MTEMTDPPWLRCDMADRDRISTSLDRVMNISFPSISPWSTADGQLWPIQRCNHFSGQRSRGGKPEKPRHEAGRHCRRRTRRLASRLCVGRPRL